MKKYFLLFLLVPIFLKAQNEITGSIIDNEGNPIPFTDIFLMSELKVMTNDRAITDFEGKFKIITKRKGNFFAEIRSLGFKTYISENFIIGTNNSNIKLGQIKLEEESFALNDVEVSSERKIPYQRKIDRTVIDVEDDAAAPGSTVLDLLERTPGIIVDRQNENINMLGKSGVNVMINGKLSYMPSSALVQFLNGVNAENVKSIELITTPPSKFDAQGNAGYINIELKRGDKNSGFNGNVTSSSSYAEEKFTNNIGNNFNVTTEKSNLIFNYSIMQRDLPINGRINRSVPINGTLVNTEINAIRDNTRTIQNLRFSYDYSINEKINIGTSITGYSNRYEMIEDKTSENLNLNIQDLYYTTEENYWENAQISVFSKYYISENTSFDISFDFLKYDNNQPVEYAVTLNSTNQIQNLNFKSSKASPFEIMVYNIDFESLLFNKVKFTAGFKMVDNDFINENSLSRDNIVDLNFDNYSSLSEEIIAGYSQFNFDLSKNISVQSGIRYEDTITRIFDLNLNQVIVERSYGNFFPSVFIGYKINDFNNLNISYSKRINRPAFTDLAPFVFFIDIDQAFQGNVQLRPSFTDNFEMNYRYKNVNLTLQYSEEQDIISGFQPSVDNQTGFVTMGPLNLNLQETISSVLSYSFYPISDWNVRFFSTYSYSKLTHADENINYSINNSSIRFNLNNSFDLGKDFTFQLWGYYASRSVFGLNISEPNGSLNIAFQKKIDNLTFTLNGTNILDTARWRFKTNNSPEEFNQSWDLDFNPPQIKLSAIYNFGNQSLKTKKIRSSSESNRVRVN